MATQDYVQTQRARCARTVVFVNVDMSVEYRHDEKRIKLQNSISYEVSRQRLVPVKMHINTNTSNPYPEPALVPLGKKPKV